MKVGKLGASMLRGNSTNFYIRCDDDLDDQDTSLARGRLEYPHIHVRTNGPNPHNDILYIGITFGGNPRNIDIYDNQQHQMNFDAAVVLIRTHCPRISADRVHPLSQYLYGYRMQVAHQ